MHLQFLAIETGLKIVVCHYPPGTSKWNKIEHRMFSFISMNWRGRPLVSHEVVVNLIANTSTEQGLRIKAALDRGEYPKGEKVSDEHFDMLMIEPTRFHGDWNYTLLPPSSS